MELLYVSTNNQRMSCSHIHALQDTMYLCNLCDCSANRIHYLIYLHMSYLLQALILLNCHHVGTFVPQLAMRTVPSKLLDEN